MSRILVVDDENSIRIFLRELLRDAGHEVGVAEDADKAMGMLAAGGFDVVLADIILPRSTGVSLLRAVKETSPRVQVILMTCEPTVETASEAVRAGAFDYLAKPIGKEQLLRTVANAAKVKALDDERLRLEEENRQNQENLERLVEERTAALRESEARYRAIAGDTPVLICRFLPGGEITYVNDAYCTYFRKAPEELVGRTFLSLIPEVDRETVMANISALTVDAPTQSHEHRVAAPDGEIRWQRWTNRALFDEQGGPVAYLSIGEDITERKQAEAALRESEERMELALHGADLATWDWNLQTGDVTRSERWTEMLGYSLEEIEPHISAWEKLVHVDDMPGVQEVLKAHLEGKTDSYETEHRLRHRSGRWVWVLDKGRVIERDAGGTPIRACGTHLDITRRKRLEEQAHQSQKMESIGRLAGGVAHDTNNQLQAILMYCDLVLGEVPEGDPVAESVAQIREAARRSARLTGQLLAFSRRQALAPEVLDLNQLIQGLDSMLQRVVGEDVLLRTVLAPGCGCVEADPGQLEQVIVNLVVNARDAMPRGGHLTLEIAGAQLDEAYARSHVDVAPGPYVVITVSDTGHGMDEATRRQVFEPFFTTKELGTGLGLSTVHGVVRQSGGHILCYSEPGKGATFKVYLPRVDEAPGERSARATSETVRGNETILVAEDEQALRLSMKKVLEREGYTVLTAANGGEALLLCRRHPGRFDLLVTDVVMPGMSGKELADELARLQPGLKALFMSGYTDNAIVHHGRLDKGTPFLQKPFDAERLAAKIRQVMDSQQDGLSQPAGEVAAQEGGEER